MTPIPVLTVVGLVLGLVLLAGLLAGQFRRGVVSELRDALEAAKNENEILSSRADRLETDMKELSRKVDALHTENAALQAAIASGATLAPQITAVIDAAADKILARIDTLDGHIRA